MRILEVNLSTYPQKEFFYPQLCPHLTTFDVNNSFYGSSSTNIHFSTLPTTSTTIKYMIKRGNQNT